MEINKKLETFYLRLEFGKKCVVNGKRHTHMMSISLGLGFRLMDMGMDMDIRMDMDVDVLKNMGMNW